LDREGACRAAQTGTGYGAACDGAPALQGDWYRHRDGGYAGAGDPVAEASRSKSCGALRRAYGIARRERLEKPREGPGQGRQRAGTTWADPVGVALPNVPERQRAGAVVSHADRGAERRAQNDNDRGTGAQAADSAVAPGHGPVRYRTVSSCGRRREQYCRTRKDKQGSSPDCARCAVADDDPRWRQSVYGYGCNAVGRMDPPPRSLARRSV